MRRGDFAVTAIALLILGQIQGPRQSRPVEPIINTTHIFLTPTIKHVLKTTNLKKRKKNQTKKQDDHS